MKINQLSNNYGSNPAFKSAFVSINALSDTHGNLLYANNALEELRENKEDVFYKEGRGRANILAVCGDWFMDGARKGYISNPERANAKFQLDILNGFINQVKGIAQNTISLFTPGNHEFDGGIPLLDNVLANMNAEVIISNLDMENSEGFSKSISGNKILNEKIVEVEDDKNPNLKHKLLFLGVSPVNMFAYQKDMEGVSFLNNIRKSQANVKKEDYQETLDDCKQKISRFKKENPNGVVILMSHTGVEFADNLAKESSLDLVFDGHEHKDEIRYVKGIPIVPLSQNFKKLVNAKISINDEGQLNGINLTSYSPLNNKKVGPLQYLYRMLFDKDIKPEYIIKPSLEGIDRLDVEGIRRGNNFLANFVTDSILAELKKKDSTIDFFALNASAIRHSLNVSEQASVSNFDIMDVLNGIKESEASVMTTKLKGIDITYMVLDNFIFNRELPEKNPLIHYSGLQIDRTGMIKAYDEGASLEELSKFIIDASTNKSIDTNKNYKIANVEKYFNKSQNDVIKRMKDFSEYTGNKVQHLFKQHFLESGGSLFANCDIRIK